MEQVTDHLDRARGFITAGDWDAALGALELTDEGSGEIAERFELRAQAEYGRGRLEAAVDAWEQLHRHQLDLGEHRAAARAAAMVAMYLMMDTGLMAPVRGWLRRAEQLIADDPDAPAHALVAMTRAYERFMCGDVDAAGAAATRAVELGRRWDVLPAVVIGRVASARVKTLTGEFDQGLDELDEVGSLLMSGAVDPLTTGMMYCELICAAQNLGLHQRAAEWTEVMERWRHGAAFGGIHGRCRVHRAELLRFSGPCDAAEAEALAACDELRPWMRREFGWPLVELGLTRLRKGDLDGAEAAFTEANEHAWSPHPGLALVYLERGDTDTAAALIDEAIAHPFRIPWKERPPFGELQLAPLREAQAEIAVARGELDVAVLAAAALREIADAIPSPSLDAGALLVEARVALTNDDTESAARHAASSLELWAALGAPFEAARARTVLGHACLADGNDAAARLEWLAARDGFASFGARRHAGQLDGLLADVGGEHAAAPAPAAAAGIFRLEGPLRIVELGGLRVSVPDLKGYRYIEHLLATPHREYHAVDLARAGDGAAAEPTAGTGEFDATSAPESSLPTIDDEARAAYRRRLAEIDEDIADAKRCNDPARAELAEHDRDFLVAELRRAVGFGGRERRVAGTAERARTSVTRSIRYSINKLREHHPTAAEHLDRCLTTGTYCSYRPDPLAAITWMT